MTTKPKTPQASLSADDFRALVLRSYGELVDAGRYPSLDAMMDHMGTQAKVRLSAELRQLVREGAIDPPRWFSGRPEPGLGEKDNERIQACIGAIRALKERRIEPVEIREAHFVERHHRYRSTRGRRSEKYEI